MVVKKEKMKTPISYYGGKQSMLKHILPIIPEHRIYVEPFFGGGAVFFGKEPSKVEVINDYNSNVVVFYQQLKTNFAELKKLIDATPYSRDTYKSALVVYNAPHMFRLRQLTDAGVGVLDMHQSRLFKHDWHVAQFPTKSQRGRVDIQ
jgi:DNA adenine methylase